MGLKSTFEIGILSSGAIGSIILILYLKKNRFLLRFSPALAVIAIFLCYKAALPDWKINILNSGIFRIKNFSSPSFKEFEKVHDMRKVVFHEDGPDISVVVELTEENQKPILSLKVNGKVDASSGSDMNTQLHCSHIPLLLHPDPKDMLIIGLGSGISVGAALTHPIRRCDIVEISKAVVNGSRCFDSISGNPLDDPRSHLYVCDAKEFLQLQDTTGYDCIVSEPSNTWISGIGNLFSVDFFQEGARHLRQNGLYVQWVHLYETDDQILTVILNSFSKVFPHVTVWHPQGFDIILIGSMSPQSIDLEQLEKRFTSPAVYSNMNRPWLEKKVKSFLSLLSMQVLSSASFKKRYPGEKKLNWDNDPYVEYQAPKAFFLGDRTSFFKFDERARPFGDNRLFLMSYLDNRQITYEEYRELIEFFAVSSSSSETRILNGLILDNYKKQQLKKEEQDGADSAALDLMLAYGKTLRFCELKLWQEKLDSRRMSTNDWLLFIDFLTLHLYNTASVFVKPDTSFYEYVLSKCIEYFPENKEDLKKTRENLYKGISDVFFCAACMDE
jgi:spermidine synthase